jgi:hypothetical protein
MDKILLKARETLSKLSRQLRQANSLPEFIAIRNAAEFRLKAKHDKLDKDLQIQAAQLRLDAERRAGRKLIELELPHGGRPAAARKTAKEQASAERMLRAKTGRKNRYHDDTGLKELQLKKVASARWQKEARVPEKEFRQYLSTARAAGKVPSSDGLLRLAERLRLEGKLLKSERARDRTSTSQRQSAETIAAPHKPNRQTDLSEKEADAVELQTALEHHATLAELLAEFFGDKAVIHPHPADRRYAAHLFRELGELLANLAAAQRPI